MRRKGADRVLGVEAALRELVRDVVRDELHHFREEMLEATRAHDRLPPMNEPAPDEFLTVEQVAQLLKVIPDTVRTWIQAGALTASRPGKRLAPGPQVSCPSGRSGRIRRGIPDGACIARGRQRRRGGRELGRDAGQRPNQAARRSTSSRVPSATATRSSMSSVGL